MNDFPDGTVLLYHCDGDQYTADALCGRCRHGRYISSRPRDLVCAMAGLWLSDHYRKEHPGWTRVSGEHVEIRGIG